jgi:hypothetical protein
MGTEVSRGRPTDFKEEYCEEALALSLNGATDEEIADTFGIHVATLYRWKAKYPEFREALKTGKEACDERVVRSLYHRAVGYTFNAVKIMQNQGEPLVVPYKEHVPPDVGAAKLWLTNRQPGEWRDKVENEHNHRVTFSDEFETFIRTINDHNKDAKVIAGSLAEAGGGVGAASPAVRSGSTQRNT